VQSLWSFFFFSNNKMELTGVAIINNGLRNKREGGGNRFIGNSDHIAVQSIVKRGYPNITFTKRAERATMVIVPPGVTRPGKKLLSANPVLGETGRVWALNGTILQQVVPFTVYSSTSRKNALSYTTTDRMGRPVKIDVPANLEPTDSTMYQSVAKVDSVVKLEIPPTDYITARRTFYTPAPAIIVPTEPPTINQSRPIVQQPTLQQLAVMPQQQTSLDTTVQALNVILDNLDQFQRSKTIPQPIVQQPTLQQSAQVQQHQT
jgi:hypothetical protein